MKTLLLNMLIENNKGNKILLLILIPIMLGIYLLISYLIFCRKVTDSTHIVMMSTIGVFLVGAISALFTVHWSKNLNNSARNFQQVYLIANTAIREKPSRIVDIGMQEIARFRSQDVAIKQVLCRLGFRHQLIHWDHPNVTATFHGAQSVWELCRQWDLSRYFTEPILELVFGVDALKNSIIKNSFHMLEKDGSSFWHTGTANEDSDLEGTYAALRYAEILLTYRNKNNFTAEDLFSILSNVDYDLTKCITRHLYNCFDHETGGFRKSPNNGIPTIPNTGIAIRIFNILYRLDKNKTENNLESYIYNRLNVLNGKSPYDFIMGCLRKVDLEDGRTCYGFSNNLQGIGDVLICGSYFAANSLKLIEKTDTLRQQQYSDGISIFIESCLKSPEYDHSQTNGFSAKPGFEHEDIMHTLYALKLAQIACPQYLDKKEKTFFNSIGRYVNSCKASINGVIGYRFRPTTEWVPHVFATCVARNIAFIISNKGVDISNIFSPHESLAFFMSCYNTSCAGFVGYPLASTLINDLTLN